MARSLSPCITLLACFFGLASAEVWLENEYMRFSDGVKSSYTTTVDAQKVGGYTSLSPSQPHYKNVAGEWKALTYTTSDMNIRVKATVEGVRTDLFFNCVERVISHSSNDDPEETSGGGTGILQMNCDANPAADAQLAKLNLQVNTTLVAGDHVADISFAVWPSTSSTVSKVELWYGTKDDYVGDTDQPVKTIGDLSPSGFTAGGADGADTGKMLFVKSDNEGLYFFSTHDGVKAIVSSCCDFNNIVDKDPLSSSTETLGDGSYGFKVYFESSGDTWESTDVKKSHLYYAAGPTDSLDAVLQAAKEKSGVGPATSVIVSYDTEWMIPGQEKEIELSTFMDSSGEVLPGYGPSARIASITHTMSVETKEYVTNTAAVSEYIDIDIGSDILLGDVAYGLYTENDQCEMSWGGYNDAFRYSNWFGTFGAGQIPITPEYSILGIGEQNITGVFNLNANTTLKFAHSKYFEAGCAANSGERRLATMPESTDANKWQGYFPMDQSSFFKTACYGYGLQIKVTGTMEIFLNTTIQKNTNGTCTYPEYVPIFEEVVEELAIVGTAETAATAASAAVAGAVAASVGGAVGGAVGGGAGAGAGGGAGGGGGGGGGGDPVSMIFAVQFTSVLQQLDLPDMPETAGFKGLGGGLAWANLQVSFPMKGVGKSYDSTDNDVVAARRLHVLGEKRASYIEQRRLTRRLTRRLRILEDEDEDEDDDELSATEQFLMSMGMSAEELVVNNIFMVVLVSILFITLHIFFVKQLEIYLNVSTAETRRVAELEEYDSLVKEAQGKGGFKTVTAKQKKEFKEQVKKPPIKVPDELQFPVPEVLMFFMYYQGVAQTAMVVLTSSAGPGYKLIAVFEILVILAFLSLALWLCVNPSKNLQTALQWMDPTVRNLPKAARDALIPMDEDIISYDSKLEKFSLKARYEASIFKLQNNHGRWRARADSRAGSMFLSSFGMIFKKMSTTGLTFFFFDCARKILFIVVLAVVGENGKVQLVLSNVLAFVSLGWLAFFLPYNKFSANVSEMTVYMGQLWTMLVPLLAYYGLLDWKDALGSMTFLAMGTIAFAICRTMMALAIAPCLFVYDKISDLLPDSFAEKLDLCVEIAMEKAQEALEEIPEHLQEALEEPMAEYYKTLVEEVRKRKSSLAVARQAAMSAFVETMKASGNMPDITDVDLKDAKKAGKAVKEAGKAAKRATMAAKNKVVEASAEAMAELQEKALENLMMMVENVVLKFGEKALEALKEAITGFSMLPSAATEILENKVNDTILEMLLPPLEERLASVIEAICSFDADGAKNMGKTIKEVLMRPMKKEKDMGLITTDDVEMSLIVKKEGSGDGTAL